MLISMPKRQRGFMAIVLVVFLVVFVAFAAAMVSMSTSGNRASADQSLAMSALFAAESGVEWAARTLKGAADPEADCNGLSAQAGATGSINGEGSYNISQSNYDTADGGCFIVSRGQVGQTVRQIQGKIPSTVIEGSSGGSLFDDPSVFNGCNGPVSCGDGFILFERPGGGGSGQPPTNADGSDLLADVFVSGDAVYFAANFEFDPVGTTSNTVFEVELRNNLAECTLQLPELTSPCAAPGGNPLYDVYDVVLLLGDDFANTDVNQVRFSVNWGSIGQLQSVRLTNGCIGREPYCESAGGDDPTDEGSWDENP